MIFTTSWDDGAALDLRIAELLDRYGCTGTFYVCPKEKPYYGGVLREVDIRHLSALHEIGAHSITHPHLPILPKEEVRIELWESKAWVEAVTEKPCTMFCYPYGEYTEKLAHLVSETGFRGARTVKQWHFETTDPYTLGTSLHLYPFPLRPILSRKMLDPLRNAWTALRSCGITPVQMRGWLPMATALFLFALRERKQWFHLWGHGWEVEKYGMWKDLEHFLAFVQESSGIDIAPNSALIHLNSSNSSPRHT